jgi:hypothetical protein
LIVADDDGAVVIPAALVDEVAALALEQEQLEAWIMQEVGPRDVAARALSAQCRNPRALRGATRGPYRHRVVARKLNRRAKPASQQGPERTSPIAELACARRVLIPYTYTAIWHSHEWNCLASWRCSPTPRSTTRRAPAAAQPVVNRRRAAAWARPPGPVYAIPMHPMAAASRCSRSC